MGVRTGLDTLFKQRIQKHADVVVNHLLVGPSLDGSIIDMRGVSFVRFEKVDGKLIAASDVGYMTREEFSALTSAIVNLYHPVTAEELEAAQAELLLRIEEDTAKEEHQRQLEKERRKRKKHRGFIYILKAGTYYKIGISKQITTRMEQIIPKLPFEAELIHTMATDEMFKAESYLHSWFDDKRTNGEWFALGESDIEWLMGQERLDEKDIT